MKAFRILLIEALLLAQLHPALAQSSRLIAPTDIQSFVGSVIAPVATGVQATDTANLQGALNATPAGGWLQIPCGTYQTSAALVIANPIKVSGCGVGENMTGEGLTDAPWTAPFLYGTVIVQNTAATDVIDITGTLLSVHLSDFGLMFAPSIIFANTGHGINAQAALVSGQTWHQISTAKSNWRDISVFGTDGNHYAYRLVNFALLDSQRLRGYGGGIAQFVQDDPTVNGGNGHHSGFYGVVFVAGSAHAYSFVGAGSGSFGLLNLMKFDRPQANFENFNAHFGTTAPTASQKLLSLTNSNFIRDILIEAPDFEADISGVSNAVDSASGLVVIPAGGVMPPTPYTLQKPYNASAPPTVAVLSGAGTGATTTINPNGLDTDMSGTVVLTTGTGTPSGDMFTVTYGTPMVRTPKFVNVFLTFALTGVSQQFSVHTFSASGFTVQSNGSNPAASTGYQVSWIVEQ